MDPAAFVRAHTVPGVPPYLPEIRLRLAGDAFELWERTEEQQGGGVAAPPFWGFPWAGGQALARHLLDHPGGVAGRPALDPAAGSGPVAAAPGLAGAAAGAAARAAPD